jgi:hypothetical protein
LTTYLDGVVPSLIVLHGTLGPLDERLDVIAVLAMAFMALCFVGYVGLGRKKEQLPTPDTENKS